MAFQITDKKSLIKRIVMLLAGVILVAIGVAFSIKANLGTAPVSSLPYVLGQIIGLSTGVCTIIIHAIFIALQVIILKKEFKLFNLFQLPLGILFGSVIDLASKMISSIEAVSYGMQIVLCIIGIVLIGIGVAFEVEANVILLAIEGFCAAVVQKTGKKFGDIKTITDSGIVASAVILGLIFLHKIAGVREGTVAAAILVGQIAKLIKKLVFTKK